MLFSRSCLVVICLLGSLAGASTSAAFPTKNLDRVLKASTLTLDIVNLSEKTSSKDLKNLSKALKKLSDVHDVLIDAKKGQIKLKHGAKLAVPLARKAIEAAGFRIADPRPASASLDEPLIEADDLDHDMDDF